MVTRLVADLEDHLGTRLLQRTTRRLSLTEAGQTYLSRVRNILQDIDEAHAVASSHTTELAGLLRLHAPPVLASYVIAPLLAEFRRRHPQILIDLEVHSLREPPIEDFDITLLGTDDRFDADIAPALPGLRWQVVHGDLNPHNILADPAGPDRVTGILDFGDMVRTPLVCDLAIAASYRIDPAHPLDSLSDFAAAWHATDPLTGAERALLPDLVAARMVTTVAITARRAARYPANAAYILRNVPSARAGLAALATLDRATVATTLAAACP